jgi:hypothetical protein
MSNESPMGGFLSDMFGDERFEAMIKMARAGKITGKVQSVLTLAISGREYDILTFASEVEQMVSGHTMVDRAVFMEADLGEEDGQYVLDHQQDIPVLFRGRIEFVFTSWRRRENNEDIHFISWDSDKSRWVKTFWLLTEGWFCRGRVLRPKHK